MPAVTVPLVSNTGFSLAMISIVKGYKCILAVSDNVMTGEMGFLNTDYYMAESTIINVAFDLVKKMEK